MYIIPGFITDKMSEDGLIITSSVRQNSILLDSNELISEYKNIKNEGCSDLNTELRQFLHEQELLLSKEETIKQLDEVKDLLNQTLLITLMPTEGCNFRCPYCYENHDSVFMSDEHLQAIKNFIHENITNFNRFELNWFGGEPTLCMNVIKEFSQYIFTLKEKYNFNFISNITTNGYLLNIDNFKTCYECGIRTYQITIDGFNHDQTRPFIDGSGTLSTIINNLKTIHFLPKEYQFKIIIRHNILSNDFDLSWYDYLHKLFGDDERFGIVVRSVNDWGGDTVKSLSLLKEEKTKTIEVHQNYIKQIGMDIEEGDNQLFGNICYAGYPHSYIFRPNGSIVKCSVALDNPLNIIGNIEDNKVNIHSHLNELWFQNDYSEKCLTCTKILSCMNMNCRHRTLIEKKDHCKMQEVSL